MPSAPISPPNNKPRLQHQTAQHVSCKGAGACPMFINTCARGHHSSPPQTIAQHAAERSRRERATPEQRGGLHAWLTNTKPPAFGIPMFPVLDDAHKCCRCTLLSKCWISLRTHHPKIMPRAPSPSKPSNGSCRPKICTSGVPGASGFGTSRKGGALQSNSAPPAVPPAAGCLGGPARPLRDVPPVMVCEKGRDTQVASDACLAVAGGAAGAGAGRCLSRGSSSAAHGDTGFVGGSHAA